MQGVHWAQRTAQALVAAHPNLDTFVLAAGISPSKAYTMSNFREIITTYFVVCALKALGKKTRFIFSWDDFDRFRSVPDGLDPSYERYIGMPYSAIPDPNGCCASYAAHIETTLENTLRTFGIEVDFLYQTQQYQSGRYREGVHLALVNRHRIYDILQSFNANGATPQARHDFYPVNLYCERCGKDHTHVNAYDEGARMLYYTCKCNFEGAQSVREATTIKLIWKVDWPMRWREEQVVYEPGGRNHSALSGSYNISSVVSREIFNYMAPAYTPYESIAFKTREGIMLNEMTPELLMQGFRPEVILSMFLHYQPHAPITISLDDDVAKYHATFERLYRQYREGTLTRDDQRFAVELCLLPQTPTYFAPYAAIGNVLPLVDHDLTLSKELLGDQLEGVMDAEYQQTCERVHYWITHWHPERAARINRAFNRAYYVSLSDAIKLKLKVLLSTLSPESDGEAWVQAVAEICKSQDIHATKRQQHQLFEAIYHLLISKNQGPKLPLLIDLMGTQQAYRLLAGTVR